MGNEIRITDVDREEEVLKALKEMRVRENMLR